MCIRDTKLYFFLYLQNLVFGLHDFFSEGKMRKWPPVFLQIENQRLNSLCNRLHKLKNKIAYPFLKDDCLTIKSGSSTIFCLMCCSFFTITSTNKFKADLPILIVC